jgi:hypothetical protein
MKALVYDLEIVKAILGKNEKQIPGIEYCQGWHDHANMGISVLCAYEYETGRYRTFCQDNLGAFVDLAKSQDLLVSFNGLAFDNKVIEACIPGVTFDYQPDHDYDLLVEAWAGAGLGPTFNFRTHGGYGLDAICERNLNIRKTSTGAFAPVLWQQGAVGAVIDYCLNDVWMTKCLFDLVLHQGWITSPKTGGQLTMRRPGVASAAPTTQAQPAS